MTVSLRQGQYQGIRKAGVTEYRGVPFAQPPLGAQRFKAPQPLADAKEGASIHLAEHYPLPSLQAKNPAYGIDESGEDCLYLNLWVPEGDGPFPVMVWFHGGGYQSGSISQRLYHGATLARNQQVIVVNAAYRLGAMGFADFNAIAPQLEADSNLGLRDQLAALQWVQQNITAFGGDRGRVTIFGESAGGFSVCALLACPPAATLFQQAIVQSGGADFALSPQQTRRMTEAFVDALPAAGNGEEDAFSKLRHASSKDWIKAQNQAQKLLVERGLRQTTPQYGMNFLPMVDGELLPQLPIDAIAQGAAADKRLLAGVCRDEFHFFQYGGVLSGATTFEALRELTDSDILHRFERALPGNGQRAFDYYRQALTPDPQRGPLDWPSAMESDRLFRVPTLRLLDAQSRHQRCWGFQFTWASAPFGVPLGACHVVDVPFVFGITDTPVGLYFTGGGDGARALSERVQQEWGRFAHGEAPNWADWSQERQVRQFGHGEPMATLLDPEGERLWESLIPPPS